MKEEKLPLGFVCVCGQHIGFSPYVYAHWRDVLKHKCEKCNISWNIVMGMASRTRGGVAASPFYRDELCPTCGQVNPNKLKKEQKSA